MGTASPRAVARRRSASPSSPSRFRPRSSLSASRCSATSWMTRRCATCGSSTSMARTSRCYRPPPTSARPMLAPDGRAYVYMSDASGADRIYLQRYPDDGQAQAISGTGPPPRSGVAMGARSFLFLDGRLMSVAVDLSERIPSPSSARELFAVGLYDASELNGTLLYDVAEDGTLPDAASPRRVAHMALHPELGRPSRRASRQGGR